jgi:hypothetical protein
VASVFQSKKKQQETQHGVKALDGGDADAADAVELPGLQVPAAFAQQIVDFLAREFFGRRHETRKIAEI